MQKESNQGGLLEQQFQQAQALLGEGRLTEGCQLLMALYNQGYEQETIYSWLYEQSAEPNCEALDQIYQENREKLLELYPQYYLPARPLLFYQAFPLGEGEFALYDTAHKQFIYEDPDDVQLFHLMLQADALPEILDEQQEAALAEAFRRYIDFSREICVAVDRVTEVMNQPIPSMLAQIELLRAYNPYDERYNLLLGKYYLVLQDYTRAEAHLKLFMETNQHNLVAMLFLVLLYRQQGRTIEEAQLICKLLLMRGQIFGKRGEDVLQSQQNRLEELKQELPGDIADLFPYMGNFLLFPAKRQDLISDSKGNSCMMADYVFPYEMDKAKWNLFVGLAPVTDAELQLDRLLYLMQEVPREFYNTKFNGWTTVKLDTRLSKTYKKWQVPEAKASLACAVMATNGGQKLTVKTKGKSYDAAFPAYFYRELRLTPGTEIESDQPFIVAKPVELRHSPRRKKLCLGIFLDAGSYHYLRSQNFSCAPNIRSFFEKGIIFDNNYTTGEYTFSVAASLMTGTYITRNQFYLDKAYTRLSENLLSLGEKFSDGGYFCSSFCAGLSGVSTQLMRGFDKITSQASYNYPISSSVADLIEQLKAYEETDNFVWLYNLEMHKIFNELLCPLSLQVKEPFEKVYGEEGVEKNTASVHQKYSWRKTQHYQHCWETADFNLGILFRYIEEHYAPDEYVITLFSDHGVTAVDNDEFILKPAHTHTCFMVRGAGVPARGIVTDEVTSAVDLYPTLCHLAGLPYDPEKIDGVLPKAFGGPGREYTLTEVLFPSQTYKLCVRDLKYELRILADSKTLYDGSVNLDSYTATLYDLKTMEEADDPQAKARMLREAWRHMNHIRSFDPPPPTGDGEQGSAESEEVASQIANL